MNTIFSSTHLETLVDLQALAKKHDCTISFGCRSDTDEQVDNEVLRENGATKEIIEKISNGWEYDISINNIQSTNEQIWFQLYDPNGEKHYNVMTYNNNRTYFEVEFDYNFEEENNRDLIDWLEEHSVDWNDDRDKYIICLDGAPTIINGFGYEEEHKDYRVYREGMALHYFTELVCNYLNEPIIKRTY